MASVFQNESNNTGEREQTPDRASGASVRAANPTFVVASASAAAVPVTEPFGAEQVRKLLSKDVNDAVAKARRDAGVA
jgi:hypothetical protein